MLVSIFGRNLANETASAKSFPLPTALAGTSVTFDGTAAPLLYVSPSQINLQVPSRFRLGPLTISVVVITPVGSSEPASVLGYSDNLGIFALNGSGCGRAAVFNLAPDGSISLNSPTNSAEPGSALVIFGTGIPTSRLRPQPVDGEASPANPPATRPNVATNIESNVGGQRSDKMSIALFAGRAPGYVGLDQFNVALPADTLGCSVPLFLTDFYDTASQSVPVSIHRGGGQCVDPPAQSIGILRWKKTVISAFTPRVTEELIIEFSAAPGKQPPKVPDIPAVARGAQPGDFIGPAMIPVLPEGPPCPDMRGRSLDAGVLTVQPAGAAPFRVSPGKVDGRLSYTIPLPAGTIRQGTFMVSGAGGSDVGPFTTSVDIPQGLEITQGFSPGTYTLTGAAPLTWTGVTPDTIIRVDVKRYRWPFSTGRDDRAFAVIASARSVRLYDPIVHPSEPTVLGSPLGAYSEVVVSAGAEGAQEQSFQASGLTLGGRHGWTYEFVFTDLNGFRRQP